MLLNLGRLGTEKNIEELIAFFAEALKQDKNRTFLIVGGGPAKEDLEKYAKELGLEDHVIFTGMVPPALVQEYYQLGDVFVSASTSETQGLTYIEAAANGLPLLCRKDDCICDVVLEGENGFQYTDLDSFLRNLQFMAENKDWCKQAKERSKQIAETFDKSHFGDAMEAIYESTQE